MIFRVGDMVEVYGKFIGYITYLNLETEEADVEFENDKYWDSTVVPFKYLTKVGN